MLLAVTAALMLAGPGQAAPYAEMVIDARTGEVLRSRNADTRLHPASLTKMMTLYIAFEAIRRGEITLDSEVRISRNAASEPPSKLGLRSGQKIALRYLIRAAAVKSANDAATAIGEAIAGSESAFADRMNRTARALGMGSTTFRNAHGLTQSGHMSTARDMTVMGRRLFYDYPEYYNLFSRRTTDAGVTQVRNTNRRLLNAYKGADGIKTGYTNAAGFNLVASAERGSERVIATVFGGRSTATRNARIAELLDLGFERAPTRVTENRPALPTYGGGSMPGPSAPATSLRPMARSGVIQAVMIANATGSGDQAGTGRVVTRASTSGGRTYGIALSPQTTRSAADKLLLRTALQELDALDDALRRVSAGSGAFTPSFVGLSEREATRACTRLRARDVPCEVNADG
ncbi:MAG: D-alanyl-D-alanine carboxypeptidase family protein [Jannaschia sp.]